MSTSRARRDIMKASRDLELEGVNRIEELLQAVKDGKATLLSFDAEVDISKHVKTYITIVSDTS